MTRCARRYRGCAFGSGRPGGAQFALTDGTVQFIGEGIDPQVLTGLSTRGGGEVASF